MVSHSLQEEAAWTCSAQCNPREECFPVWLQGNPGFCCAVKGRTQLFRVFPTVAVFHGWAGMHSAPSPSPCPVWFSLPAAAPGAALAAVGGGLGSSPMPWLPPAPLTEAQPGPLTPRKLRMLEKTALFALLCPPWDKQGSCTVGRLPRKAGRQAWKRRLGLCL